MDNEKIGQFILELRKSRKMTQKELAERLNITDKAVSKWERGLSCPDISLLSSLADILGVTTSELLNGERSSTYPLAVEETVDNALKYADKAVKNKTKTIQNICAVIYSMLLFIGILVCIICDLALTGTLTWSLYPIICIVFAWLVVFPTIKWGKKGVLVSLIALSVFVIPYLWGLSRLVESDGFAEGSLVMQIGVRSALISLVFIWGAFVIFKKMYTRKLSATAITLLLAIPTYIVINLSISKFTAEPIINIWNILSYGIIIILAGVFFAVDFGLQKKKGSRGNVHSATGHEL